MVWLNWGEMLVGCRLICYGLFVVVWLVSFGWCGLIWCWKGWSRWWLCLSRLILCIVWLMCILSVLCLFGLWWRCVW